MTGSCWPRLAAVALALAGLAGCASFSGDGGFAPVEQAAQKHLGKEVRWARREADREAIRERVAQLLREPLDADAAVQLALLNNPGLQAAYEALGIGEAELVRAGRLPNPSVGLGRLVRGDELEWERSLHVDLVALLTLPMRRAIEERRFAQAQGEAATAVLVLAADTRRAWVQAVAAEASVRYAAQVTQAAEASAELARRMAAAGNFNTLQRLREQSFQSEATLALARAEQARRSARERLTRLLGLWGESAGRYRLPERLPDLPAAPRELPEVESLAIAQRLDVQGARLEIERREKALGLTGGTRFAESLQLGLVRNSSNQAPVQRGVELSFELPIFDAGRTRLARDESLHRQALARAAETAINARSEVREAYAAYRSAWDIAKHQRDELVPLRQRISEENLLRYNGMLIGVFELLADARAQVSAVNAALESQRDFWLAQADLDLALVGRPGPTMAAALGVAPAAAAEPAGGH